MDAIAIGPLLLSLDRLYALAAIALFIVGAQWLASRRDAGFSRWSTWTLVAGFLGARLVYVTVNWSAFHQDIASILYVWQGGFAPIGAIGAAVLVSVWYWRHQWRQLPWALVPPTSATLLWIALVLFAPLQQERQMAVLPSLSLFDMERQQVQLSQLKGQPLVINLWATWCAPCRREMPLLDELEQRHPEAKFLFINVGDSLLAVDRFLEREQLTLQHVLLDPARQSLTTFQSPGLPTTLFFTPAGELTASHVGEISRALLERELSQITKPH